MKKLVNLLDLPKTIDKLCIKLNMCDFRLRETGATSDPLVVDAMLNVFRGTYPSSRIFLVENDATTALADVLFRYLGIEKVAKKYNADIINLAHEEWVKKEVNGYVFRTVQVPVILENCDLFVTHPKLKTHSMTKITCGLKNNFGCLRPKVKSVFHKFIDDAIVDINLAVKTDVSIVDAYICQEGFTGPAYGIPKKVGLLIGGNDIVAVDSFCARLAGFRPWWIGHIRKASSKGLGRMSYDLRLIGLETKNLKKLKFNFNRGYYYTMKTASRLLRL